MRSAFYNPASKLTPAVQAGLFNARKRNKLATALVDSTVAPAYGTIAFPGVPANDDTVTINGTIITFVSGTPSGAQIKIVTSEEKPADNLALTLDALLDYITANPISGVTVSGGDAGILIQSVKPADTTPTLAASAATVSGANLVPNKVNARVNANSIPVLP